jgi:hypothetical protein
VTDAPTEGLADEPIDEPIDEAAKRRRRTVGYLSLWKVEVDLGAVPVPTSQTAALQSAADTCNRAMALCLLALKGQGLTQLETFAFADAYGVWDALDAQETDFILDAEPTGDAVLNYAWKYEGLHALEWALGLNRHLIFPVDPIDPAKVLEIAIRAIATVEADRRPRLRTPKELLDAADVARCLAAIAASARREGVPMPGDLHPGVVHERDLALSWLLAAVA